MKLLKDEYNIPSKYYDYDLFELLQLEQVKNRGFMGRAFHILQNKGIITIGNLLNLKESDLLFIEGIGNKTLDRLYHLLKLAAIYRVKRTLAKRKKPVDHIERLKSRYINRTNKM